MKVIDKTMEYNFMQSQILEVYNEILELVNCEYGFIGRIYRNGVFKFLFIQDKEIVDKEWNRSDNKSEDE